VVAFGSWAVGEFVEAYSDLNLLVVTRRLDADTIRRLAPHLGAVAGPKCRPLVFSQAELRRFAEAFPLEFQDMADTRKVLYGEDPFGRFEIRSARLAEELESEAHNRLIKFRQRWLLGGGHEAMARELAAGAIAAILPLLRGLLRLKKRKPPRQRVRVIEEACRQFRLSRRTLLQAHDLRYGRKNASRIDAVGLLDRLLVEMERLAELSVRLREEESGASPGRERDARGERHGDERSRALGGDKQKRLAEVRQAVADASQKKRWEPKEPDRFASDEMGRDSTLSLAARFGWDKAWQPERRARGYVPVKAAEPEPPLREDASESSGTAMELSSEEAAAVAWADEVPDDTMDESGEAGFSEEPPAEGAAAGEGTGPAAEDDGAARPA
jgi:predicted nucleotidyltransferase